MDVAQRIALWKDQSQEQWLKTANRYLPPGVTAVLVVAIAYQLAVLTWRVLPGAGNQGPIPTIVAPDSSAAVTRRSADFGILTTAHLFGEAPPASQIAPTTQTVVDAPDTTLSLRLTGIIYGQGGILGQAIIASGRDQEKTYQLGQAVDNANSATLHAVYGDRVLLNRDGRLETLRLPQELSSGATQRLPPRPLVASEPATEGSMREVISANASRLTDIMRIAPHVEEGQVVGFRINPGRDRAAFELLGLQPGDVVTDINGTVLDDPSRGLQVFESLGEATMANVTVLRNGVPELIVIDTSQLKSLEENRQ